jgi:hypothetical protein
MRLTSKKTSWILLFSFLLACCSAEENTNSGNPGDDTRSGVGEDPFIMNAWHLFNTGQKNFAANGGTAGIDLQVSESFTAGLSGKDIKVLVSDDGMESTHEDLKGNFESSGHKDYTLPAPYTASKADPKTDNDNHGTCVAGLIAATGGNKLGSAGVASKAKLHIANFLSESVSQLDLFKLDQMSAGFDVYNQSWGYPQYDLVPISDDYLAQLESTITTGRGGKGSLLAKSAGNDYTVRFNATTRRVGNSGFDGDNTTPFTVIAAALNAKGSASSYSSPGANIWISTFGGEFGDTDPALVTTDRSSCDKGYAEKTNTTNSFEKGGDGNTDCNYTSAFNGTSSASPEAAGVIALLLEANPDLTWRQIKHILAATALKVDAATTSYTNPYVASPTGHTWEQGWVTNAALFHFHNRYGFGLVQTDAAVAMAKAAPPSLGTFRRTLNTDGTWMHVRGPFTRAIPDNSATGVTDTVAVTQNYSIEAVQIRVKATHANIGQIGWELTSPAGTKSIVIPINNALDGLANFTGDTFLTNAFYGESSAGTWTLKAIDGRTGTTGNFTGWELLISGH